MIPRTKPAGNCDIVMKGGITSGVVYPLAVVEIAKHFRIVNIGGSSAGAIAAAAAAAAEHGRAQGGFELLETLPDWLGSPNPVTRQTNLFSLFQPQAATRQLFEVATAQLHGRGGGLRLTAIAAARAYWKWVVLAVFFGGLVSWLGPTLTKSSAPLPWVTLGVVVGSLAATVLLLWKLYEAVTSRIPGNFFGLCSGLSSNASSRVPALTEWLSRYLNKLAAKPDDAPPLTFGELWWPDVPAGRKGQEAKAEIRLEMITSCLSHGRPYQLPFRDDSQVHESKRFAFHPAELRRVFPDSVVRWMETHERHEEDPAVLRTLRDHGLVALPEPHNIPVVVATRMSLSFPGLLSMVPLWSVVHESTTENEHGPRRCWFSDGGLCSNFPVHLFDSPLPRWPTFAINLRDLKDGQTPGMFMVSSNSGGLQEVWLPTEDDDGSPRMGPFMSAMLKTMQNWNDNGLARLPGQRDRIAHVTLTPKEGGLNLNMPQERIRALADRGRDAGKEFVRRFGHPADEKLMNWSNHRWIRLRTLLASVQEMIGRVEMACQEPEQGDLDYESWLQRTPDPNSYRWASTDQFELAIQVLADLRAAADRWGTPKVDLAERAPRPLPVLRPRPRA